ncbi:MAG TPA: Hsp70 family protein [Streptosporangiaceae bacterium]|nr:Hsp70 family protein [Streptosporangiaceae bacterium]
MTSGAVLGIDLGTTNSVAASIDEQGRLIVLRNSLGSEITPSVVFFEPDGGVLVGEEALQAAAADPDHGVRLIKRQMGTRFPLMLGDQEHTPESISALILRQLAAAAGPAGGAHVVITVPAYFGLAEREATYQAGLIAGLDVLELLDEPVAAAAHYGLTAVAGRTVLVYDLGGGTFDTTVLRIADGEVTVLATDGHHELGGADVDERLIDLVLERLAGLLPPAEFAAYAEDSQRLASLRLDVEGAKHDLSARVSRDVVVRTPAGRVTVTITRADLEAACGDLFDSTAEIIERVLAAARAAGAGPVDDVIMVGGSSRIPVLATRLTDLLGVTPRLTEPDLAVAKGAALRAHQILATPQLAALARPGARRALAGAGKIRTVAPRAIGILVDDSYDPAGARSFIEHLVPANAALPVSHTEARFGTILDGQESARIQVYEQAGPSPSAEVAHNRRVLDGELTGLGALPAGSVIRITIQIALDGRLTVIAQEPVSGRELALAAFIEGVVDSVETDRLTRMVGLTTVRG